MRRVELVAGRRGRLAAVSVDGRDVTDEVRGAEVDQRVRAFAAVAEVRAALVPRQRALAAGGGIVMAGRDIGTASCPTPT